MGLHSEVDMTLSFIATRLPIAILSATLAILTAHLAKFAQTFLAGTFEFTPDEVETFYETP